jgi:hypothetical protein
MVLVGTHSQSETTKWYRDKVCKSATKDYRNDVKVT